MKEKHMESPQVHQFHLSMNPNCSSLPKECAALTYHLITGSCIIPSLLYMSSYHFIYRAYIMMVYYNSNHIHCPKSLHMI